MSGKRYIPERTVDSLLAAELVRYDPYALIWSPSQRDPNPIDHEAYGRSGSIGVFECKAVIATDPSLPDGGVPWRAEIDTAQLARYRGLPYPILYLLVAQPDYVDTPYNRRCSIGSCAGRLCKSCARDERSWGALSDPVKSAPVKLRFQPWFAHWSWVLSDEAVEQWVNKHGTSTLLVEEAELLALRSSGLAVTRLCHLMTALSAPESESKNENLGRFFMPASEEVVNSLAVEQVLEDPDDTPPVVYSASFSLG